MTSINWPRNTLKAKMHKQGIESRSDKPWNHIVGPREFSSTRLNGKSSHQNFGKRDLHVKPKKPQPLRCACGHNGFRWKPLGPNGPHRYRVECLRCDKFVKWGTEKQRVSDLGRDLDSSE